MANLKFLTNRGYALIYDDGSGPVPYQYVGSQLESIANLNGDTANIVQESINSIVYTNPDAQGVDTLTPGEHAVTYLPDIYKFTTITDGTVQTIWSSAPQSGVIRDGGSQYSAYGKWLLVNDSAVYNFFEYGEGNSLPYNIDVGDKVEIFCYAGGVSLVTIFHPFIWTP